MKYYTGVGSRKTPKYVLDAMREIAIQLSGKGLILRSGGADGADSFFELGCDIANSQKEIYIPYGNFNKRNNQNDIIFNEIDVSIQQRAKAIARSIHPNWVFCSEPAKMFHARNILQVLGKDLKTPSKFVVCWTPKARLIGGTRTAIIVAENNNIPVFNLASPLNNIGFKRYYEKL